MEEGRCFSCGEKDHRKSDCPKNQKGKEKEPMPPSSKSIPDVQGNTHEAKGSRQLLKGMGSINNQRDFILFDPRSTDNFISLETAHALNLSPEQLGTPISSGSAFQGQMQVIGKFLLSIT